MIEYFKSVNNKYTYDNDKYLKMKLLLWMRMGIVSMMLRSNF